MPSVKRAGVKSAEVKTGYESYDGPQPRKGMYRGRVTAIKYRQFKSGSTGLELRVILEAQSGDPKDQAKFDGYMTFPRIVFGDKEQMITRENNLYAALGVKDEPTIVYDDKDDVEAGATVTKLGGKNVVGVYVNVDLRQRRDSEDGDMEVDGVYKFKDRPGSAVKAEVASEDDEDDLTEDDETEEEAETEDDVDAEVAEREVELNALTIVKLRAVAKELELDVKGLKKDEIVSAVLDAEFPLDDEESDEDEEEEESEEEEEDDSEEEEDEEEEEEDEDGKAERQAELEALDRVGIKKILKELQPDFKVLKSTTEAALIEAILDSEFGDETPF